MSGRESRCLWCGILARSTRWNLPMRNLLIKVCDIAEEDADRDRVVLSARATRGGSIESCPDVYIGSG